MSVGGLDPEARGIHVLPNSTCFTAYGETQQVNVRIERDFIKRGAAETFTIDHAGVDEAAVLTVPVIDVDQASVVLSAVSGTIQQGVLGGAGAQDVQYNVSLDSIPTQDVTVTFVADKSSLVDITPSSLVFRQGEDPSAQTVTISAVDASTVDDVVSDSVRISHIVESLDAVYDEISVADFVADWYGAEHPRVIISASSIEVVEGDSDTVSLSIKLGIPPSSGSMSISLASTELDGIPLDFAPTQLTFTSANFDTVQAVDVSFPRDYEYRGAEINALQLSFAVDAGSAAPYADETLVEYWPSSIVTVNVREVDLASVSLSAITGSVQQGTIGGGGAVDATYNISLSSIPIADVTISIAADQPRLVDITPSEITFLADQSPSPALVTVSAADAELVSNVSFDILRLSHTASSTDLDFDAADIPDYVADWYGAARPKVVMSLASLAFDEASSGETFSVKLGAPITSGTVTVTLASSTLTDGSELTVSPASLTFTSANWNAAQAVQITYPQDNIYRGDADTSFTITVDATGGQPYADSQYVIFYPTPTEDVTVSITPDDTSLVSVSPASVTFAADTSPSAQTITVSAADPTVVTNVTSALLTLSHAATSSDSFYNGIAIRNFVANWYGSPRPRVLMSRSALEIDEDSSTGDSFTVKLAVEPTNGDVTISLVSSALSDSSELTISPASLTFTSSDWDTAQTVQVTYPKDDVYRGEADTSFTIAVSASGSEPYADSQYVIYYPSSSIAVDVHEVDQAAVSLSAVAGDIYQATVGGSDEVDVTYTINLASTPTEDVTVSITPDDTSLVSVSPASVTFTADTSPSAQTITVSAADPTVVTNVTSALLTLSHAATSSDSFYNGIAIRNFVANWYGSPRPRVLMSRSALEIDEGSSAGDTFTVKLAVAPSNGDVTISLVSSALSDSSELIISPTSLTFTSSDWNTAQTVQVTYPKDDVYRGEADTSFTIAVIDVHEADQAVVTLSSTTGTIRQGAIGGAGAVDATYTVNLASAPTQEVTISIIADQASLVTISPDILTFPAGQSPSAQIVTISAADATAVTNVTSALLTLSHTVTSGDTSYDGAVVNDFVANWYGSARPRVSVSTSSIDIVEGASSPASMSVKLDVEPSDGPVNLTLTSSLLADGSSLDVSSELLVFTTENWSSEQVVEVQYPRDFVYRGANTFSFQLELAVVEGSSEPYMNESYVLFWPDSTIDVTVREADQASVTISDLTGTIRQGAIGGAGAQDATYTMSLTSVPEDNVTISITPDNEWLVDITPSEIVFSAGVAPPDVLVTVAAKSATQVANVSFDVLVVSHSISTTDSNYAAIDIPDFEASWYGAAHPRVVLSAAAIDVVEGTEVASIFYVKLGVQPSSDDVSVDFASSILEDGSALLIDPTSVSFSMTDWDTEQPVRVTYPRDYEYRGAEVTSFQVLLSVGAGSGEPYADAQYVQFWPTSQVEARVYDADLPEIVLSEQTVYVTENGQSAQYELVLNSRPAQDVNVSIANPNSDLVGLNTTLVVFTSADWDIPQTIRVVAIESEDDNAYDLASAITILQHSAASNDTSYDGVSARFSPSQLLIVRRYEDPTIPNCPGGTYLTGETSLECVACPAGYKCPVETNDPAPCLLGSFSIGAQVNCTLCPRGMRCPQTNSNSMDACAAGTYSIEGQADCTICPAGKQCPSTDSDVVQDCPSGSYSLAGSQTCTVCPAGKACPDPTGVTIHTCEPGTYTETGMTSCVACPAGYACTDVTRAPIESEACEPGTFAGPELGNTFCTECPAGYSCPYTDDDTIIACASGEYSAHGNSTSCPAGSFCPTNATESPQICPAGTYSYEGATSCEDCDAGYYCEEGAVSPTPVNDECEAGTYCPSGGPQFNCPAGSYGTKTGGVSADDACDPCPAGYYCPEGSTDATKIECTPGYYCPQGTSVETQYPCSAGYYNPDGGSVAGGACLIVPEGRYAYAGSSQHYPCPSGYYCPEGTTHEHEFPCAGGTYSGIATELKSQDDCLTCTVGMNDYTQIRCQAGHYCPSGNYDIDAFPCPAGTYTDDDDLQNAQACTPCPPGYACLEGTGGSVAKLDCAVGHYCPEGTTYTTQYDCPRGSYTVSTSLTDVDECTPCPAGSYCEGGLGRIGAIGDVDGHCSPGHYCPASTYEPNQFPCPDGTYTASVSLESEDQCTPCDLGHYCFDAATFPVPCPAGSYANETGESDDLCTTCPAGYECPEGTIDPIPCQPGNQSASGQDACDTCEAGYFCKTTATTRELMHAQPCSPGLYCPEGVAIEPSFAQHACPDAHYCPQAIPAPLECPVGTYNPVTGQGYLENCTACDPGYYCIVQSNSVTGECDPGHYCPAGSTGPMQFPCPARTYRTTSRGESENSCSICTSGYYCEVATVDPVICPKGYYCLTASSAPKACPIGRYGNFTGLTSGAACTPCPGGYYCDGQGLTQPTDLCDEGYYCMEGSYTSTPNAAGTNWTYELGDELESALVFADIGDICPPGYFCPRGSAMPIACDPGTFNSVEGATSSDACLDCTPGHYCAGAGNAVPTGLCEPGYVCPGRSEDPTDEIALPGTFAPEGSAAASNCAHGTFNSEFGKANCTLCYPGFYCPETGLESPEECPEGMYCPEASISPSRCPEGTYSNSTQLGAASQCTPCDPGSYCASNGLVEPSGFCAAGYYCLLSSTMRIPSNDAGFGGVCPAGYYCMEGTASPEPCPLGTFGTKEQAKSLDDCKPCEPGSYCGERGLTAPSGPCAAGYYCNGTSSVSSQTPDLICPTGFRCPAGTSHPIRCDEGTYAPDKGASNCTVCPGGYFCDGIETTLAFVCPAGSYCPPGTGASPPRCPPGTFSTALGLNDISLCSICPAGQFCADYGLLNSSGMCDPGYVCDPGSKTQYGGGVECYDADLLPYECPRGHYSGRWCFEEATAYQDDFMCPTGHYCESSTALPIPCPAGTFRDETGAASAADCEICPSGEYCPGDAALSPILDHNGSTVEAYWNASSGSSFAIPCPAGTFCTGGNVEPELCPIGFAASSPGMSITRGSIAAACTPCPGGTHGTDPLRLECATCDPGYICVHAASTPRPLDVTTEGGYICPVGHYCPAGSTTTLPCPPGTFANETGAYSEEMHCLPCASNTYNELWGAAGCKPCASSSSSESGSTACNCQGRNRAFEASTGKCLCVPGFEAFDQTSGFTSKMAVDEDGTEDCQPITYERCALGEVLNADGLCVSADAQCATECADLLGTGRLSTVLGVCDCDGALPLEQTCGVECRANATDGYLVAGSPKSLTLSDGTSTDLSELEGFYGVPSCASTDACAVLGCEFGNEGSAGCDYDLPAVISSLEADSERRVRRQRRRLVNETDSDSTMIAHPVLCINTGDTLVFKLEADEDDASGLPAYPVYKKDSLLNTNPDFDYGHFRYLEGAPYVRVFAFTFQSSGMYVFGSSRDLSTELIVSVQPKGSACPTEAAIMPRSTATLFALGAKRSETILLEPDWSLLGTLLGGMAGLVVLLLTVVYCFREFALGTVRIIPTYRNKNRLGDAKKLLKGKKRGWIKSRSVAPMAKVFTPGDAAKEGLQPLGHARWAEEDVDPRELVERMVSNHEEVHEHLNRHDAKVETLFGNLQVESQELKEMLKAIKEDGVRTIGGQPLLPGFGARLGDDNDASEGDDGDTDLWSTPRDALDSDRSGSLSELHRKEQQLLEKSWQESAERELEELNTKLDEEAEEAMLEEQLKQEEQLEDLERMLLEREDISDEERERILRDFERDQEMLRDTLDLEKRRQQEDLKNRLAERNLRSYRATKRRQRSEREEEEQMQTGKDGAKSQKASGPAGSAVVNKEAEARKMEQVAKLLAIQEEAELEELDVELQRERVQAEADLMDDSKSMALSGLDEEARAKLEREMIIMRASSEQNAEDHARKQKEELRERLLKQKRDETAQAVSRARKSIVLDSSKEGGSTSEDAQGESQDKGKPDQSADISQSPSDEALNKVLNELAEEEVEAKVEIEAALEEDAREETKHLQKEMASALAKAKETNNEESEEAKTLVTSIREDYKRKIDQLQEETAAKRKQQYEALKSRLKNRRRARVKEIVQDEDVSPDLLEKALDEQDSDADIRLEMELQERHKEDVGRRLELDKREAELRRREAEVALRLSAEREGKDAEAEVKRLRESHEAALATLGQSQAQIRDKQRDALKRRAQERKEKREREEAAKAAEAAAKAEAEAEAEGSEAHSGAEGSPGDAESGTVEGSKSSPGKREGRASALWENAVDRISVKLTRRIAEARALEEEKARLGAEHEKVIEEMRKRQEEERKRLEEEMEAARQKLLLERKREEAAAMEHADEERRRREEEAALSAKTAQELEAIKEQHERDFSAKQEQERLKREKQREKVMKKLEEKKARKRQLLERRHQQTMKKHEAKAVEQTGAPQMSREDEMRQEKAAISQLMKHASPDGIEASELYRGIEKILEPRHTREKLELSQRQFQQRTQQIKTRFAEVQNEKHERKKAIIQSGASLDEIEKLEAECKEKLRVIEDEVTQNVEEAHKVEQDELTRRHAQEIGKYVSKYSRKPKETIQQDAQVESTELRAMLDKEREFRLREIQNERAAAEFRAREAFDKAILDLERGLRDYRAEHAGDTAAVFEARKAKLLQKQMTSHDIVLKTARDDTQRREMRAGFELERERLATAIRAEHLRQVKSVEARVERLKAKSARYYRRVLDARLRDIADVTTRKVMIMDDALRRMFAQRNAKVEAIMASPSEPGSPGSPFSVGGADALYYEQAFQDSPPQNLAELQALHRSESMRRISALQGTSATAAVAGVALSSMPSPSTAALEKKLEAIELLLQSMRGISASSSGETETRGGAQVSHQSAPQYTDPLDAGFTTSSEVVEIASEDLLPTELSRLRLGDRILRVLGLQGQVSLRAARSVPSNQAQASAFKQSFSWDESERRLYLRVERFTNVGDFVLVLVHCLAHIKVHKTASAFVDADPIFIQEFHAQLRSVNNALIGFAGVLDDEDTDDDGRDVSSTGKQASSDGAAVVQDASKTRLPARLSAYSAFSDGTSDDGGSAVLKLLRDLKLDRVNLVVESEASSSAALVAPKSEHAMHTKLKAQVSELEKRIGDAREELRTVEERIATMQGRLDSNEEGIDKEALGNELETLRSNKEGEHHRLEKLSQLLQERKEQLAHFLNQNEDMKDAVSAGLLQDR
ncbi:Sushi, von Willebrand factor type A, EGF and pentraxin domain-containing protein 1 [Hondaea fermentalgiana]|uniref:Sushi, von Willebrand factor type A, EGF and pentraxin domain-containing protein 1 n=1 Tax=Hondaea fermentalgiana TaxID=2315210 RepID=A0A2R5G9X8_9STRA|nr:Sushi, von Willebrand factor type A, EGF and pentraxin domain-containing protein 1 [Hondaea fermentalgiana]|eukprot:GBG24881.1 Sushi, von Willebrand factor type A, EGF and pentraxin domain-containing protein 1 [Hondaea fermentalgiana]